MTYPAEHFPDTPLWAQAAVEEACRRTGVTASKWQVPLEAIGRYESNWNNNANLCSDPALLLPLAAFQLHRNMYTVANKDFKLLVPLPSRKHDPECSAIVAVLYINSKLVGFGGYLGIGEVDGSKGLLPRTDRGPGNVLRDWIADPVGFDVEAAREAYRGY
jgi:hypothetical protein